VNASAGLRTSSTFEEELYPLNDSMNPVRSAQGYWARIPGTQPSMA
jgi:hypothetical protein